MNIVKRKDNKNLKKVLIVGDSKTGKSTFCESYCQENNLNAVVLDIENTNFTDMDLIVSFDLSNDMKAYRTVRKIIKEVEMSEYDTIVLDGIDSLLESFISEANGLKAYSDRSKTFNKLIRDLDKSGLNVIFIGQSPCDLGWYKEENPNKCIIRLNARVNEVYKCSSDGKSFNVETISKRGV